MSKYINPYTDFGFKKLFGEEANKDLLIDFLNSFLPQEHQIQTLSFRNPNYVGLVESERNAFFDIFCTAKSGQQFIVEMQKAKHNFFKDRALFYVSYPIREQSEKGKDWSFELPPIYFLAILDFKLDERKEREKVLRTVELKDQDCEVFYDKLKFIFIQMPSFKKQEQDLLTHQDKWLYFLKNLTDFDQIPSILKEPIFEKGFGVAEIAKLSREDYNYYEQSLLKYAEIKGIIDTAFGDGEKKRTTEIVINGYNEDFTFEQLSKITKLSVTEIEKIILASK
ncbi:MAG: Rpn family recombination-promoting nuclease/putative transposase [Emticicia sp.]